MPRHAIANGLASGRELPPEMAGLTDAEWVLTILATHLNPQELSSNPPRRLANPSSWLN